MLQQTLQFQKEVCDASFTIATSVQENCENILKDTLKLYPMMPKEGKELCLYCSEQYWLSLNRMRKTSLASIDLFEKFTAPPMVFPTKKTDRKKAAPAEPKKSTVKTKATTKSNGAVKKQTKTTPANAAKTAEKKAAATTVKQASVEKPAPSAETEKTQTSSNTTTAGKS